MYTKIVKLHQQNVKWLIQNLYLKNEYLIL